MTVRPVPVTTTSAPTRTLAFFGAPGSPIDSSVWNFDTGGNWGNGTELQQYTNRTANAHVDGSGDLVISTLRETYTGSDNVTRGYTSARLNTLGKVSVAPGSYVEASIKAPVGAGLWPAFWLLGTNINQVGWPKCGEVDILEGWGADPTIAHTALHLANATSGADQQYGWGDTGGSNNLGVSIDNAMHTYGVYFDASLVQFFIDGKIVRTIYASDAVASGRAWPFGASQFIVVNTAIAQDPNVAATTFPRSMLVSPISIYAGVPATGGGLTPTP